VFRGPGVRLKALRESPGNPPGKSRRLSGSSLPFIRDFFTAVKLRSATHREHEGVWQHGAFQTCAIERHESRGVVIIRQGGNLQRVRIQRIVF